MTTATQVRREAANSWETFLDHVKARVSINTFTPWFQPTRLNRAEGETLFIQIPSAVFRQVLTRTYGDIIKAVFHELGTPSVKVQYVCSEEEPVTAAPAAPAKAGQAKLDFESSDHQLNLRYTFDTFVVGKSNEFAHAASRAVAEQPSKAYNPLFLYGGVGMGKTHLMHAIGHTIKKRNPAMRLSYVSAEKFTIEVINSLRFDRMISFRERFHTVDVLLVDDIQFIAGKERTQEEFFHTFNALYEQQKQIVISSDCLPKDINSIEERLRSRFEWGLIADIQPPEIGRASCREREDTSVTGVQTCALPILDVLLVDDIQFIAGKERTQEEFFHTFNALYEQQKQIVISSDCLPKDINSIEERLRSRFEWGLIADIQPPDLETKIAILQKKAENE